MNFSRGISKLTVLAALAMGGAGVSQAAFVNCPSDTKCNGNLYTITSSNAGGNLFDIVVTIDTAGYTGSTANDAPAIGAVQIQSFTSATFSIVSFTASGGNSSPTWLTSQSGLDNSGCDAGVDPGTSRFCGYTTNPYLFDVNDILTFTFRVNLTSGGTINNVIHVKNLFLKNMPDTDSTKDSNEYVDDWRKEGDLGSFDVRNPNGTGTSENPVPEPATYGLIAVSLIGAALLRRR